MNEFEGLFELWEKNYSEESEELVESDWII